MTGQSEVQTGSRNVSTTTLPLRAESETALSCWSMSESAGAGKFTASFGPLTASVRSGLALGLAAAMAAGAPPTRVTASAPAATTVRNAWAGLAAHRPAHPVLASAFIPVGHAGSPAKVDGLAMAR